VRSSGSMKAEDGDPRKILGTPLLSFRKGQQAVVVGVLDDERQVTVAKPSQPEIEECLPQITSDSMFYQPAGTAARHFIEHQLELSPSPILTDDACRVVEGYNEGDCLATAELRKWLEELRAGIVAGGTEIPRPEAKETAASEDVTARQQRVAALFDALTQNLPAEPKDRTREQAARWLLAHALDWHRREEKVKWWEFFRSVPQVEFALALESVRIPRPRRETD
jgi:hypothetical protein